MNVKVDVGSRVLIVGDIANVSSKRFWKYYDRDSVPKIASGIYEVVRGYREQTNYFNNKQDRDNFLEEIKQNNYTLISSKEGEFETLLKASLEYTIKFETPVMKIMIPNPKSERYDWTLGYVDTKNKISLEIHPLSDNFVLNFDELFLEDLDYYLENRVERPKYLTLMPTLLALKKMFEEERIKETPFMELVNQEFNFSPEIVWKVIKWWKTKNKYKRAIEKDDVLALRMIKKQLNKLK